MEGFTFTLALVDAIPVVLFSISMLIVASRFHSPLFLVGSICCVLAGLGKVLWKLILAAKKKDIPVLTKQFRYLMPTGFLLLLVSMVVDASQVSWHSLWMKITAFPSVLFFVIAIIGLFMMMGFAKRLEQRNAKVNWMEEICNCIIQACVLIGILLMK